MKYTMPETQSVHLEADFFLIALRQHCFAASPIAADLADPCVAKCREPETPVAFLFSDIPDAHFREPYQVIWISNTVNAGGIKS